MADINNANIETLLGSLTEGQISRLEQIVDSVSGWRITPEEAVNRMPKGEVVRQFDEADALLELQRYLKISIKVEEMEEHELDLLAKYTALRAKGNEPDISFHESGIQEYFTEFLSKTVEQHELASLMELYEKDGAVNLIRETLERETQRLESISESGYILLQEEHISLDAVARALLPHLDTYRDNFISNLEWEELKDFIRSRPSDFGSQKYIFGIDVHKIPVEYNAKYEEVPYSLWLNFDVGIVDKLHCDERRNEESAEAKLKRTNIQDKLHNGNLDEYLLKTAFDLLRDPSLEIVPGENGEGGRMDRPYACLPPPIEENSVHSPSATSSTKTTWIR